MARAVAGGGARRAFTRVELAVVVVLTGVLAGVGVPRFLTSVERSKADRAFAYLAAVRSAQERYHVRKGEYATDPADLDVRYPRPTDFALGAVGPNPHAAAPDNPLGDDPWCVGWSLTLTRVGAPARYGAYTVTFTDQGYDPGRSTIARLPEIHPTYHDPG